LKYHNLYEQREKEHIMKLFKKNKKSTTQRKRGNELPILDYMSHVDQISQSSQINSTKQNNQDIIQDKYQIKTSLFSITEEEKPPQNPTTFFQNNNQINSSNINLFSLFKIDKPISFDEQVDKNDFDKKNIGIDAYDDFKYNDQYEKDKDTSKSNIVNTIIIPEPDVEKSELFWLEKSEGKSEKSDGKSEDKSKGISKGKSIKSDNSEGKSEVRERGVGHEQEPEQEPEPDTKVIEGFEHIFDPNQFTDYMGFLQKHIESNESTEFISKPFGSADNGGGSNVIIQPLEPIDEHMYQRDSNVDMNNVLEESVEFRQKDHRQEKHIPQEDEQPIHEGITPNSSNTANTPSKKQTDN